VIKRQFGLMKVRFRGLAKNTAHVDHAVCAVESVDGTAQAAANDSTIASANREVSRKADQKQPRIVRRSNPISL
jgi:hypothetical protein